LRLGQRGTLGDDTAGSIPQDTMALHEEHGGIDSARVGHQHAAQTAKDLLEARALGIELAGAREKGGGHFGHDFTAVRFLCLVAGAGSDGPAWAGSLSLFSTLFRAVGL